MNIEWINITEEEPTIAGLFESNEFLVTALKIGTKEPVVLVMEYRYEHFMGKMVGIWYWGKSTCPFEITAWAKFPEPYTNNKIGN